MNAREFKERYLFDPQRDLIAEGTYSRVFHATDALLQRDICIKLFRKELVAGSPLIRELSRAGVFFHPNVCAFYDLVEISEVNVIGETEVQPIGIIEYMNGGTITDHVAKQKPDSQKLNKLIKDILRGLSYLHSIGKPHLDLKPGNLLIKLTSVEPVAKITDFLNGENLHTRSIPVAIDPQQLCYRAPECFESSYGEQSFRADIWSLGIIVYELASGRKLFWHQGDTMEKVMRNVCYTDYWSSVYELHEPYASFVKKCLVRNAQERIVSLEELTLTLDGYRPQEITPTAPAPPVHIDEILLTAAPIRAETPPPATPKAKPAAEQLPLSDTYEKSGGWSIPIIIGALIMMVGIWGFIWKTIEDQNYPLPVNTAVKVADKKDTLKIVSMPIDTAAILATAARVIHDTVKVIQIQQAPIPVSYAVPAKTPITSSDRPIAKARTKEKAEPSMPYFDYLWSDKPYYFDLKTPLMSDEEFDLYSDHAAITPLGKNTFYVKPTTTGPVDIMVLDKATHKKIAERYYNVKSRSLPVATIGDDITGGSVSPKMLLAKLTMNAKSDNGSYTIKSFHMTCKSGACDIQDVSDNGSFNESMIRFLHDVKPGEQLYFDNIIAVDDSGQSVKLDPFQITTY